MFVKDILMFQRSKAVATISTEKSDIYNWDEGSTYEKTPFENLSDDPEGFKAIKDARPLLILGDMVTIDHISPAGNIQKDSLTGGIL